MTSKAELVELGREWLEHSPQAPLFTSPLGLRGFTGPVGFVCVSCTGRLTSRGVRWTRLASEAIWSDRDNEQKICELCGETKG